MTIYLKIVAILPLILNIGNTLAQVQSKTLAPVVNYSFDGNALDSSINGLHLTIEGNPQLCPDRHGLSAHAYQLNGISDYFWVADTPLLRPQQFTLTAWFSSEFKPDYTRILEKRYRIPTAPYGSYLLEVSNDSTVPKAHVAANNVQNIITSPQAVEYDSWHLLCATYDGTAFKLYLDGELCNSVALVGQISYSNFPLCIGTAYPDASSSHCFKGKLDEISIYDYALDETSIRNLYDMVVAPNNVTIDRSEEGVIISWDLQDVASSYRIYSSEDILAAFPVGWTLEESGIITNFWQDAYPTIAHKFYRVVAQE